MGYQQITSTSIADLISKLEAAMVTAGWTDTLLNGALGSASGNILRSVADAEGRVCYVELFEDTAGNVAIHAAPELNAGGTDLHAHLDIFRSFTYQNATWECGIYEDAVWLSTGTAQANYRGGFGLYQPWPGNSLELWPWACFCIGTHDTDSGTARLPYVIGKGDSLSYFYHTFYYVPTWAMSGVAAPMTASSSNPYGGYIPLVGFVDGKVLCSKLIIAGQGITSNVDNAGSPGYHKHVILSCISAGYNVGDRITLDSGVTYFRMLDDTNGFYGTTSTNIFHEE
jgi:hypothetical protein